MNNDPHPEDLRVFCTIVRLASFTAAAGTLGVSRSYVTKRVQVLEARLGARLLHRSTRRVVVTQAGERAYHWALRILNDMDHMVEEIGITRQAPRGALRLCSSFGFGRRVVAPALSALSRRYPALQIRLEVFDRLVDIAAEGFDLDIRVGDAIAPQMIARRLADNHRVLCAAPAYLARCGVPRALADLAAHDCLVIKERDHPFGVWRLDSGRGETAVKVRGPLSSNHGEAVLQWARDGMGIALRSYWDVQPWLVSGELVQVLPEYRQKADVWAVYPSRLDTSARVRVCVEFLQQYWRTALPGSMSTGAWGGDAYEQLMPDGSGQDG